MLVKEDGSSPVQPMNPFCRIDVSASLSQHSDQSRGPTISTPLLTKDESKLSVGRS